jgi:predicted metal-dependent RNase
LLIRYATTVKGSVRKIFLVHGEEKQAGILTDKLMEQNMREVYYPELHSSVEI